MTGQVPVFEYRHGIWNTTSQKVLYWVFRLGRREQVDLDKRADRFLVDMRGELPKYQLWLRRESNQIIIGALCWQMTRSDIFYLQRIDSLKIHIGRHFYFIIIFLISAVFYIWHKKKSVDFFKCWRQIEIEQ